MEKHVTSLELSKKLKEQGFPQVTKFTWSNWYSGELVFGKGNENFQGDYHVVSTPCWNDEAIQYSAFLATELGEWLPVKYTLSKVSGDGWFCYKFDGEYSLSMTNILGLPDDFTESDARARLLIYLAEQKIIDPKKL